MKGIAFCAGLMMLLVTCVFGAQSVPGIAVESTMPPQYDEAIKPELAAQYSYAEDGELSDALKLPIYQWMPVGKRPEAIVLGVHGLTLHGRRFRVLARTFAVNGIGFIALDMRGFGRCRFDDKKVFSTDKDNKGKVNHEKSYADIVSLAQLIKAKYSDIPLIMLGESLGCTFCVRLAGEHQDLVNGMILSGAAVKVNPRMYLAPADVAAGVKALISPHLKVNLKVFLTKLVSNRPDVVKEMLDDPYILKELSLLDLLSTDEFVEKTAKWGKNVAPHLPVLILQGSADHCVSPTAVTDLMKAMPSDDQTLFWRGNYGHLQLETIFMRAGVVDALGDWIEDHSKEAQVKLKALEESIDNLGGHLVR